MLGFYLILKYIYIYLFIGLFILKRQLNQLTNLAQSVIDQHVDVLKRERERSAFDFGPKRFCMCPLTLSLLNFNLFDMGQSGRLQPSHAPLKHTHILLSGPLSLFLSHSPALFVCVLGAVYYVGLFVLIFAARCLASFGQVLCISRRLIVNSTLKDFSSHSQRLCLARTFATFVVVGQVLSAF